MNARTGKRQSGCADRKVLGAYGRDALNDNGERLLLHVADNLSLLNTLFATPSRGASYTFQSANSGKGQPRLDYILTRQVDRRPDSNITVRRPPEEQHESDHNLVVANIRLSGRFAPNHRTKSGRPGFPSGPQQGHHVNAYPPTARYSFLCRRRSGDASGGLAVDCGETSTSCQAQAGTEGLVCARRGKSELASAIAPEGRSLDATKC